MSTARSPTAVPADSADSADPVDAPSRRGVPLRVLRRTLTGAWRNDIFTESASAAFWQTMALPPLLLGLFGILGYVGHLFGPDTVVAVQQWIIQTVGGVFSTNVVEQIIGPTVGQILTTARGEVVSIGFVISLWPGSWAISCCGDAITRAHGQYEKRNLVWQRFLAVLLYLAQLCIGIVVLPIAAEGPPLLTSLVPPVAGPVKQLIDI